MQVEILWLPNISHHDDFMDLKVGERFPLTRASVGGDSDNHWFTHGKDRENCLDDLVIMGIEFKVVHEEAQ